MPDDQPDSKRHSTHVAYMEDAPEDSGIDGSEGIEATRQYAWEPSSAIKEQPNTSRHRPQKTDSASAPTSIDAVKPKDKTSRHPSPSKSRPDSDTARELDGDDRRPQEHEQRHSERQRRNSKLRYELNDDARPTDKQLEADASRSKAKSAAKSKDAPKKARPSAPRLSTTQPSLQQSVNRRGSIDDPAQYGVQQLGVGSGSRPRAHTRPASYYAGQQSRPPIANTAWHQNYPPPSPMPFLVGPYPQQPMFMPADMGGPHFQYPDTHFPGQMPPPSPVGHSPGFYDYSFNAQHLNSLKTRFQERPSSAMDQRAPPNPAYGEGGYQDGGARMTRRPSRNKRQDIDRRMMPPPDSIPNRPQSARAPTTPFRVPTAPMPPPRPSSRPAQPRERGTQRRSVGFAEETGYRYDEDDEYPEQHELFTLSPESSFDQRRNAKQHRGSFAYDSTSIDSALPSRRRRQSAYGPGSPESGGVSLEDDHDLERPWYSGVPTGMGRPVPLTAETLRKANGGTSTRSTRSSGSRDDSEHKKSNTTAVTRSSMARSAGDQNDIKIHVCGSAVLRALGTEIQCEDGAQITLSRDGMSPGEGERDGSVYQLEDTRGRGNRRSLPHRSRPASQSNSQSRGYAPGYDVYGQPYDMGNYI